MIYKVSVRKISFASEMPILSYSLENTRSANSALWDS